MKIKRRKFILLGLATLSVGLIPIIGVNHKIDDKTKLFLDHFTNIIPQKFNIDISDHSNFKHLDHKSFKINLKWMLFKDGLEKTITSINENIKQDYQFGNLKLFEGWIISKTEINILALQSKYV